MRARLFIFFLLITFNSFAGKVVYVSSSLGSDNNSGLSANAPLKTIGHAYELHKKNIELRLKCGDVFFETLRKWENCTITSYGKGQKPVLCGFKILKNTDAWFKKEDLWVLDLNKASDFGGFVDVIDKKLNNIGCIYDNVHDKMYGHQVESQNKLQNNGDWYITDVHNESKVTGETFRYLYFKYDGNPKTLGHLCFSVARNGVNGLRNCVLRNLTIMGFGQHGISNPDGCQIEDCNIDIIGGSILLDRQEWVRYGNGIEYWITEHAASNSLVRNCLISRTFDTGSTIQGSSETLNSPKNISFENCRFYHCRQAFERYLQYAKPGVSYVNCHFRNNISYMAGDNGFDTPYECDADLLSYEFQDHSFDVSGNTFYGSSYYFGAKLPSGIHDNVVYIYRNQYLHNPHYNKSLTKIRANSENDIEEYRKRTGDNSTIVILDRGSNKDLSIRSSVLKKINYQRQNLNVNELQ